MTVDTNSLRYLPRRSSKNCDRQFANSDRQTNRIKENYNIDCKSNDVCCLAMALVLNSLVLARMFTTP